MQHTPLTTILLFERAEKYHRNKTIATASAHGVGRINYAEWAHRTRRLAGALGGLGLSDDARVATFAWNTQRHLELYFAAPNTGRVLHTLNVRLFPDQLTYIVNHAEDEVIFVDRSLLGVLLPLLPTFSTVKHLVVIDDDPNSMSQPKLPGGLEVHDYEALIDAAQPVEFFVKDENRAASMCYTSGTTGNPKGVVYSHRSTFLNTMSALTANSLGVCESDTVMPVVPMFHANSWGMAHAAVAAGANLVLPGRDLSGRALADLIVGERVTLTGGVPTIWSAVLPELRDRDTRPLRAILCGGSAVPKSLSESYRIQTGRPLLHAWGMTETSPLAAVCTPSVADEARSEEEKADLRTTVGPILFSLRNRIVDLETATELDWDGVSSGELQVSGPWVASSYYGDEDNRETITKDGWLRTGDVATIDQDGRIRLVDRTKDLIKSGGEWVSSVDVENELVAHPLIKEAAVIGVSHPKWSERPLACVVLEPGATLTKAEILEFLGSRLTKIQLPDDVVFIDEVPKTSVGKFSKKILRERFAGYVLP